MRLRHVLLETRSDGFFLSMLLLSLTFDFHFSSHPELCSLCTTRIQIMVRIELDRFFINLGDKIYWAHVTSI